MPRVFPPSRGPAVPVLLRRTLVRHSRGEPSSAGQSMSHCGGGTTPAGHKTRAGGLGSQSVRSVRPCETALSGPTGTARRRWGSGSPAAARQLPMMGARCCGKQRDILGTHCFQTVGDSGPALKPFRPQQSFGKLASSTPREVSDAWGCFRTALLPLAGHDRRSTCALGCEGNETSLSPALRARCDAQLKGQKWFPHCAELSPRPCGNDGFKDERFQFCTSAFEK